MSKASQVVGATHVLPSGEAVRATHWKKDGDHPAVERYPIDKRVYKGIIVIGKLKLALRFGDWIIENGNGDLWVEAGPELSPAKYRPIS